jgi:hypothetical protein
MFLPRTDVTPAEVAELADALASGASGRKVIGVRVPASAPSLADARSGAKPVLRRSAVALCARPSGTSPRFRTSLRSPAASYGWQASEPLSRRLSAEAASRRRRTSRRSAVALYARPSGTSRAAAPRTSSAACTSSTMSARRFHREIDQFPGRVEQRELDRLRSFDSCRNGGRYEPVISRRRQAMR